MKIPIRKVQTCKLIVIVLFPRVLYTFSNIKVNKTSNLHSLVTSLNTKK